MEPLTLTLRISEQQAAELLDIIADAIELTPRHHLIADYTDRLSETGQAIRDALQAATKGAITHGNNTDTH